MEKAAQPSAEPIASDHSCSCLSTSPSSTSSFRAPLLSLCSQRSNSHATRALAAPGLSSPLAVRGVRGGHCAHRNQSEWDTVVCAFSLSYSASLRCFQTGLSALGGRSLPLSPSVVHRRCAAEFVFIIIVLSLSLSLVLLCFLSLLTDLSLTVFLFPKGIVYGAGEWSTPNDTYSSAERCVRTLPLVSLTTHSLSLTPLIHSLTHSLTRSLAHSLAHSFTHSPLRPSHPFYSRLLLSPPHAGLARVFAADGLLSSTTPQPPPFHIAKYQRRVFGKPGSHRRKPRPHSGHLVPGHHQQHPAVSRQRLDTAAHQLGCGPEPRPCQGARARPEDVSGDSCWLCREAPRALVRSALLAVPKLRPASHGHCPPSVGPHHRPQLGPHLHQWPFCSGVQLRVAQSDWQALQRCRLECLVQLVRRHAFALCKAGR